MKYRHEIVEAFFHSLKVPTAEFEFKFHPSRRWRFDIAWPDYKLAVEVQGGLFTGGRHTQGAALLKEYQKMNAAAVLGWRVLYFVPREICMLDTIKTIKAAVGVL